MGSGPAIHVYVYPDEADGYSELEYTPPHPNHTTVYRAGPWVIRGWGLRGEGGTTHWWGDLRLFLWTLHRVHIRGLAAAAISPGGGGTPRDPPNRSPQAIPPDIR